jgi:hypothetical protein
VCLLCQHPAQRNRVIRKSPSARSDHASRDYQKVGPIAEDATARMEKAARMEKTLEVWDRREVSANDAQVHQAYLE